MRRIGILALAWEQAIWEQSNRRDRRITCVSRCTSTYDSRRKRPDGCLSTCAGGTRTGLPRRGGAERGEAGRRRRARKWSERVDAGRGEERWGEAGWCEAEYELRERARMMRMRIGPYPSLS